MPKPARPRSIRATAAERTRALRREHQRELEDDKIRGPFTEENGYRYWRVVIEEYERDLRPGRTRPWRIGTLTYTFDIATGPDDETAFLDAWSIQGRGEPLTRATRVPLKTFARAAALEAEHAATGGAGNSTVYPINDHGKIENPHPRPPRPRKRHLYPVDETRVEKAAELYRAAFERRSRSPTVDVARKLNVGRSTAARAIASARQQGLLGPALPNRAGEARPPKKKR